MNRNDNCTCHACRFRAMDFPAAPDNSAPPTDSIDAMQRMALTVAAFFGGIVAELSAADSAGREPNPIAVTIPGPEAVATMLAGSAALLDLLASYHDLEADAANAAADADADAAEAIRAALARASTIH